jgi:hypothetical protein
MESEQEPISEEMAQAVRSYLERLAQGLCPVCSAPIEQEQQVGRCVYAHPCGHRLYQGRARKKQ